MGVTNVVNKTKNNDIPSTPKFKWQKLNWLNSDTNWNWVAQLESNSYHKNKEIKKFNKEVVNAIFFIWFLFSIVFDIGKIIKDPNKGINNNKINIFILKIKSNFLSFSNF
jgi:hypothetical protein